MGSSRVFFSLSGGLLVEFWWCLKRLGRQMCTFGVLGLLAAPKPPGFHTTARELQTCTFKCPGLQKHHQNSTRRPPEREKVEKLGTGEGKKSVTVCDSLVKRVLTWSDASSLELSMLKPWLVRPAKESDCTINCLWLPREACFDQVHCTDFDVFFFPCLLWTTDFLLASTCPLKKKKKNNVRLPSGQWMLLGSDENVFWDGPC